MIRLWVILTFYVYGALIAPSTAVAQDNPASAHEASPVTEKKKKKPRKKPALNKGQNFRVQYSSAEWNKDSQSIEVANLLIRDARTGKMAQIKLEESEPDSSVFTGNFSLNWGGDKQINPEVYVPPQNLVGKENWWRK